MENDADFFAVCGGLGSSNELIFILLLLVERHNYVLSFHEKLLTV